jgi:polysaccharide deacetylase 2 family uncharacterized protein YibQ
VPPPHRKRSNQSRRGRTRSLRSFILRHYRALALAAACALGVALAFWIRQHPPSSPQARKAAEADRRELAATIRDAIERAGGSRVWIKRSSALPPAEPGDAVEVLAGPDSFPTVLTVVQRVSGKNSLRLREVEHRNQVGLRTIDIRLSRGRNPLGRWRLREVPRLLRAAIVIDDLGQDLHAARELLSLPYPLTFSVLPHLRYSTETAEEAHRAGREVMLHLPMEAEPGARPSPGEGAILTGMKDGRLRRAVASDLGSVPYVAGVNNHMGSLATANAGLMAEVMEVLAERHLYFIDSRTTAESVALEAARRRGLPAFYRSVFLDDTETVPYTLGQLREFRHLVEEQGVALAIGHPHPSTLEALNKFLPEFEEADIQLVEASQLVRLPEISRLHPPNPPPHR